MHINYFFLCILSSLAFQKCTVFHSYSTAETKQIFVFNVNKSIKMRLVKFLIISFICAKAHKKSLFL